MAKLVNQSKNLFGNVLDSTENSLSKLLDKPYVNVSLKVFLGLYAAFAAPKLPKNLALLLDSTLVRVIFAALIVFTSLKDPVTAILIAIIFIVTLQTAAKYRLYNTSESVLVPGGISWLPSAKEGAIVEEKSKIAENVLRGIKSLGGGVVGGVQQLGGGAVGGVQQLGTGVAGGVQQLGTGLVGGVQQLGTGVAGGVQQLGTGLVGGVQQLGTGVAVGVREIGSGVVSGAQHIGGGLIGGVSNLGSCLMNSAEQIGSGLVGGVREVGSGVMTGAQHLGRGLVGSAQELGTGLVGSAQQLGGGLVGSAQELGGGLIGSAQELGGGVYGGVQQVGTGLMGGVRSLGQPIGLEHLENKEPLPGVAESCAFAPFTTDEQFNNAESNLVPGADQGSCVQTFQNQFCIQGLQSGNMVQGY